MSSFFSESGLRSILAEALRSHSPSVLDARLEMPRGPFRPHNWRVNGITMPDQHFLDGQVYGCETFFGRDWDGPDAPGCGAGATPT